MRRIVSLIGALLFMVGLAVVVDAPAASAYSSTTRTAQYWWPHNGCSTPTGDAPSGISFTYACNHHDGCYWGHWASKGTCDQWFLNDMRAACHGNSTCNRWATIYYWAVSAFGWPYYWCRCDPNIKVPMYFA